MVLILCEVWLYNMISIRKNIIGYIGVILSIVSLSSCAYTISRIQSLQPYRYSVELGPPIWSKNNDSIYLVVKKIPHKLKTEPTQGMWQLYGSHMTSSYLDKDRPIIYNLVKLDVSIRKRRTKYSLDPISLYVWDYDQKLQTMNLPDFSLVEEAIRGEILDILKAREDVDIISYEKRIYSGDMSHFVTSDNGWNIFQNNSGEILHKISMVDKDLGFSLRSDRCAFSGDSSKFIAIGPQKIVIISVKEPDRSRSYPIKDL